MTDLPADRLHPTHVGQVSLGAVVMGGMTAGALLPFVLSALAPFILDDFGWSRTLYGSLITVAFAAAMIISPLVGKLVDASVGRSSILILFGLSALGLGTVSIANGFLAMCTGAALGGCAMAISNPSTNKIISAFGASSSRGLLVGVKQSGVQVGAMLSGITLPPLAEVIGWRVLVRFAAVTSLGLALLGVAIIPRRWPLRESSPDWTRDRTGGVGWLMIYSFMIGGGVAAASAYLPLYAHERLGFDSGSAGLLLAALGATGIASRIAAGHIANRMHDETIFMSWLAMGAVIAIALVLQAELWVAGLVWVGALLLGASAIAWNAVAMLLLVKRLGFGVAGRASASVSLAFYGGFVLSPVAFGLIVDRSGNYSFGWALAMLHFAVALVVAWMFSRRTSDLRPSSL